MTVAGEFKELLKQQADIVRIVGDYVKLKKAGAQNFCGICPFHLEKTPSFSVHATRQFFHCFGCGASGDVFGFVQKIENITFPEAVHLVAEKMGIAPPKFSYTSPEEMRQAKRRASLFDIQEAACQFFEQALRRPEAAHAREYLKRRGLDQELVRQFRIGFASDSGFLLRDYLRARFREEVVRESGLFSWKQAETYAPGGNRSGRATSGAGKGNETQRAERSGPLSTSSGESFRSGEVSELEPTSFLDRRAHAVPLSAMYSKFRNRVMFPIANEQGKVIAFTGRRLSSDERGGPKYFNSSETPIYSKSRVLFNLDKAKEWIRKEYAILVEGQMDCISVFAAGFHNVVATSGTAFTQAQAKLLARFTKNVVVNFDPDAAGAKATERTLGLLIEEDFEVRVLGLEPGFDPDLYIRERGKDAYREALRHSERYFDYLIHRARAQFAVRSPEGKVKAVNYLLPHIQRVPSRIVRDELAQEIAQKLGIDSVVLRQELKQVATARSAAAVQAPVEAQVTDAERLLVRALSSATQIRAGNRPRSGREGRDEEFDPSWQAQFALRAEQLHRGLGCESLIDALLSAGSEDKDALELPRSESDRRLLAAILIREEEELSPERLEGAIKALRRIALRRKLEDVQRQLQAARASEPGELEALLEEKVRLKRALMDARFGEPTQV